MKEIKVTIEGKEFTIDIDKAKELGVLKDNITINVGDVYMFPNSGVRVCFIHAGYHHWATPKRFRIIGSVGLTHYSDSEFLGDGATETQAIEWVNQRKLTFVGNINESVSKLIDQIKN